MPAPTNISFATATDIGTTLPYDTTQTVDDAGTTYTVWYKYTAQAGDTEISVFPWGGGGSYTPDVTFWLDASTQYLFNNAQDRPSQIPVTPGVTYGFKLTPPGGNPSPALLTLHVELGPDDALSAGMIAINDSTSGYPAVIMSQTTAAPVKFVSPFAAGEGVQVLQSGIVCAIEAFETPKGPRLYDQHLALIATPSMPTTGYTDAVGSNQRDTFWVLDKDSAAHSFAVSISNAGVVGTPLDLGNNSYSDVQPQADNTAVYGIRGTTINKITNPGGVVTLFKNVDATFAFGDNCLMMTDDTLLVQYRKAATTDYIRRFNLAGVEQSGSPYSLTGVEGTALQRIFAAVEDPAYFWIWYQDASNNYFRKIKVSDGTSTTIGPWPKFVEGDYQPTASATPSAYFGADFSCVPWIIRGTTTTQTFTIRRQRRFLLPSSPDNKWMQIPTIELLPRTGIGLTPTTAWDGSTPVGANPQVMWRLSKDGGKTWSAERWVSAGMVGNYLDRVRILRATGNYRNAVAEVTVSDPVDWQFLAAMGTPVEGSS